MQYANKLLLFIENCVRRWKTWCVHRPHSDSVLNCPELAIQDVLPLNFSL